MTTTTPRTTESVLRHHLEALTNGGGVDPILEDYAPSAVLLGPLGVASGHAELRLFFEGILGALPAGFWAEFKVTTQEIRDDVAFIVWTGGQTAPLGTDTFIVRDGKIVLQTFAAYMPTG